MKLPAVFCSIALLALAVVLNANSQETSIVEFAKLSEQTWSQFAPQGKEVDAIYGDYVLRNRHITAVIAQPLETRHANMTVRDVAGALIDLTVRDHQSDQLSAFYPGKRAYPFRSWSASIDNGKSLELTEKNSKSGQLGSITVKAAAGEKRPAVEVTYKLNADDHFITVITKFTNSSDESLTVPLEDDLRADGGKEYMTKSPNGNSDLFWFHDRYWGQAYGIELPAGIIQSQSNSRTSVLKYQTVPSGEDTVKIRPGKSYEFTRRIFPGKDLLDVKARVAENRGTKTSPVEITIRDGSGRPISRAEIEIVHGDNAIGSGTTDQNGLLKTALLPGSYSVRVTALGAVVSKENDLTISVGESSSPLKFQFELNNYKPGTVIAVITDADGQPIPCKVEFIAKQGTPTPDFGPESADFAVKNLYYAPLGTFTQELSAGRYDVIISRGPEYDAIFTELTVPPGKTVSLTGQLRRSVQTPGWVSGDFHSHSSPSGDNTGSQFGRVLNLVCEQIEFAPCTEHNRISTYQPHIDRLKIGSFISTVSGMELTGRPLPLNHQNTFPLKMKPHRQDGGGPRTSTDPEQQIERLALWDNRSEKLIQQNHPDLGWLFYDKNGDQKPDNGYERSFPHMEVVEIHPIPNALNLERFETLLGRKGNNRVFNWLQLLNQGFRIFGVVNTDAHYNYHGSGGLRNWIQSPTDNPAKIDPMDMVHAAEQGRMIISNGPYLEVEISETGHKKLVTAGQDLEARSGKIVVQVRVQCPNWFDVDRVFILVNGRIHAKHHYTREKNPDQFRSGVVKFDRKMELTLDSDAHIVVVTGGEKSTLGTVAGPNWGRYQPAAMSNPVFVDIDGSGFRANKDTLGHPLPVKYAPPKK